MHDAIAQSRRSPNLALLLGDDPLARLVSLGPAPLALWELLVLVWGPRDVTGRIRATSGTLATNYPSVQGLAAATFEDLAATIGPRRAGAVLAALELGRRAQAGPTAKRPTINGAADVHQLLSWGGPSPKH